ncbi:hypothetical protein CA13_63390 [Planctomycetes bacterium CA13]|uniref:Transposase n=1 Tax=Novipirellula herctigrandis TaxID=2527986 RepID=A0A5C5ZCI4_9BACT|nr:hypothetical protein CA13_63390 [Planctomycetes bacterium CA13]
MKGTMRSGRVSIHLVGGQVPTGSWRSRCRGFLELLDWTGRQLHRNKVGKIPDHLAPILSRIGLDTHGWCDIVKKFGRVFKRAAGTPESLAREAVRCGQGWLCAPEKLLGLASV